MKRTSNWRGCYKLYSVQLSLLITVFSFVQFELLPMWQAQLSPRAYVALNSGFALVLFLARLIKKGSDREPPQG